MTNGKAGALALLWGKDPWPDWLAEAVAKPLSGHKPYPDNDFERDMARSLAWQVVVRVRRGLPVPPKLQAWFNHFAVNGNHVPKRPPDQKVYARTTVAFLHETCGMSKAEAIRRVADATGRTPKAVETDLYRQPYKKK